MRAARARCRADDAAMPCRHAQRARARAPPLDAVDIADVSETPNQRATMI